MNVGIQFKVINVQVSSEYCKQISGMFPCELDNPLSILSSSFEQLLNTYINCYVIFYGDQFKRVWNRIYILYRLSQKVYQL